MALGLKYQLAKVLDPKFRRSVYIDGGLGSQIVGLIVGMYRREMDPRTRIDTTYFLNSGDDPVDTASGVTQWPWELDRYGFFPEQFDFEARRTHLRPSFRDQYLSEAKYYEALFARDWTGLFPIVDGVSEALLDAGVSRGDTFGAIHLRRGDYLRVGSRVVGLDEVKDLLRRVSGVLPGKLLIFSDSQITDGELRSLRGILPSSDVIVFNHPDNHVVHGAIRHATFIITSNSTFSWSAALLREKSEAVVVSPQHFYGRDATYRNSLFQAHSEWMFMN